MITESVAKWFVNWVKQTGLTLKETNAPAYTYVRETPLPKVQEEEKQP